MEWFIEIIFECVIQLFGDAILDALLRSRSPIANTLGNSIVAGLAAFIFGGVSLAIFPRHLITSHALRITALLALPLMNGLLMSIVGRRYIRIGRPRSGYEHFIPAFAFSLTFGAMRFFVAK